MSFEGLANYQLIQTGDHTYKVSHGSDKNLLVEFYIDPQLQEAESNRTGHKVYKDVEMIRIRTPGLNGNTLERRVKMDDDGHSQPDPDRFPRQWAAFQKQQVQLPSGTPIEQWAILRPAQIKMLKAIDLHVVEQIAGIPDTNLQILGMDGRKLRDLAIAYLNSDKAQIAHAALIEERDGLKRDLQMLKESVAELKGGDTANLAAALAEARKELAELKATFAQASAPKKRGPKPKNKESNNVDQI